MRALVTGGAGFIGSSLAGRLVDAGWTVKVFDNLSTGFPERVPDRAEFIEGDLRDASAVEAAVDGAEIVFHEGAVRSVPRSVDEPVLVDQSNVLGTLHVLMAASRAGVRRVVYASSSSVYGDAQTSINHEELLPSPLSPYAASKLAGEYYCGVWSRLMGLSTISLRYFNVFGPGQPAESKYAAVFPAFVSALLAGQRPQIHWDGEQMRDFTYIDDVVRANVLAAEAPGKLSGAVVNIAGGDPKSVNEVLRAIADAVGEWIEPEFIAKRAGDVRKTHADVSRARDLLGWVPQADWKQAVASTVEWFQSSQRNQGS